MSRWLAIDHGARRIGLAVGSTEEGFSAPLAVLPADSDERLAAEIDRLAQDYAVDGLVVGWPVNMDETEGPQGHAARRFASRLAACTGRDVRLWDERLSSFHADTALAGHLTRKKRKARQDAVAAAAILDDFLRNDGPGRAPKIAAESV